MSIVNRLIASYINEQDQHCVGIIKRIRVLIWIARRRLPLVGWSVIHGLRAKLPNALYCTGDVCAIQLIRSRLVGQEGSEMYSACECEYGRTGNWHVRRTQSVKK